MALVCRLFLFVFLLAGASFGGVITVLSLDDSRGQYSVWLKLDNTEVEEYYAGAINIRVDQQFDRTAFCIDLFTSIGMGDYDSILTGPGADTNLRRIGWLIDNELPGVNSASAGAGLQVAIWDIIHDNGDGLDAGRIQRATTNPTPVAVVNAANLFLNLSSGNESQEAIVYSNTRDGVPAQRLVSDFTSDGGPVPTPEVSSLGLTLSGALLVIAGLKFRTKV